MLTMQSVVGIFAAVIHPYDVAAKNKEGITIYYRYINDGKELELSVRQENTYFNGEVEWVESFHLIINNVRMRHSAHANIFF